MAKPEERSGKSVYYKGYEIQIWYNGFYSFYVLLNSQFVQSKGDYSSHESALKAAKRWIDDHAAPLKSYDNSQNIAWVKMNKHGGSW